MNVLGLEADGGGKVFLNLVLLIVEVVDCAEDEEQFQRYDYVQFHLCGDFVI